MKKLLLLLILIFNISSCSKQEEHSYTFYYWRTTLSLNDSEKKSLEKTTTPLLYTRFFDVDKINDKFQPVGTIIKDSSFSTNHKIVPVIYITTRTFNRINKQDIAFLSDQVHQLINKKSTEYHLNLSNEIQIDCDWTSSMKEDYFEFLRQLKQKSGKDITSTLRLHQVKDKAAAGIPPVSKVYLMCYSTSSPLENSDKNSILDVKLLKSYLSKLDQYPIKNIDIALPIYSWGIVTNHIGEHKLINALSEKDLENPNFIKISDTEVQINKDGFYFGHFLNKDFKIKIEEINPEQLQETINFLNKKIKNYNIVYYHLDSRFTQNYTL